MSTVLGLDVGPNSIGWGLIFSDENKIIDAGVRIFPEGVENFGSLGQQESKNAARRKARGTRRQYMRFRMRRDNLKWQMQQVGLFPNDKKDLPSYFQLDPYEIRCRALDEKVTPIELGRAMYHINERRGFKSNRKAGANEESKIFKGKDGIVGISETEQAIVEGGFRTLGEMLYHTDSHQFRRRSRYTKRAMYEHEFDLLWSKQKEFYPELLTKDLYEKLFHAIFFQRKLKSQKGKVAKCTFEPQKRCAPKSSLIFQSFRILEQLSRLTVTYENRHSEPLTTEEKNILYNELELRDKMTFKQITKLLGFPEDATYNLEHESKLYGNRTAWQLIKLFGKRRWKEMKEEEKEHIWHTFYFAEDTEWLQDYAHRTWSLEDDAIQKIQKVTLEQGYGRLSRKAMLKIIPFLMQTATEDGNPMTYDKAAKAAGYHHSEIHFKAGKSIKLPPAKDLRNPIVQQAINEVRKLVNALVDEYGNPDTIKVELVRELKMPRTRREKLFSDNLKRKKEHEEIREILINDVGIPFPSRNDIIKYRLWLECDKTCPYSGRSIHSLAQLYNGEFEIEHILPYSKSLDDSYMNKTLCHRDWNAIKGGRSPYQAWGGTPDYDEILERAKKLPYPKYRRFLQKNINEEEFIARQLVDTAYIAKEVRKYLTYICQDVQVVPGTVTARLRRYWGLNDILSGDVEIKTRDDHRHHAVDALVVANTERKYVQHMSTYYNFMRETKRAHFPMPWEGFRADVEKAVNKILVSHKQKHSLRGPLHKDSFYGMVRDRWGKPRCDTKGQPLFGIRKSVLILKDTEVRKIADNSVRQAVVDWRSLTKEDRPPYPVLPSGRPIKRVRIHDVHNNVVELRPGVFVEPGTNHHMVIFEHLETGKRKGVVVSLFEAVQRARQGRPVVNKTAEEGWKYVMTLKVNDMVLFLPQDHTIDFNNSIEYELINPYLYRVQKMDVNCIITFRNHIASLSGNKDPGILWKVPNTFNGLKIDINKLGKIITHD